jgi:hypothetical protein
VLVPSGQQVRVTLHLIECGPAALDLQPQPSRHLVALCRTGF